MKFEEAKAILEAGGKVKRAHWHEAIGVVLGGIRLWHAKDDAWLDQEHVLSWQDITADDWEEVVEAHDWAWACQQMLAGLATMGPLGVRKLAGGQLTRVIVGHMGMPVEITDAEMQFIRWRLARTSEQ